MKRHSRLIASAIGLVVLIAVATAIYLRFGRATDVAIIEAARGTVAVRVAAPGTVQARVPVSISARITASVARINADVGDAVKRGQVLVLLDDRDLTARRGVVEGQQESMARNIDAARATVVRSEADLDLAHSKHRRDAELKRTGFVSQAVLDASDAALRAASANLDNSRAALAAREADARALSQEAQFADTQHSFTRLIAPMDGVITQRLAEAGSIVVPGSPLLRMVDPATLWVATRVDESVFSRVQLGQAAGIRLRSGEVVTGKVARIARQSDAATRELEVDVSFDSPLASFVIDQEAQVAIATGEEAGVVVPLSALTRDRDGRQGVLAVVNARAEFRPVQSGNADEERVLIVKGLAVGERLIAIAGDVRAGTRVRPLDTPKR